MNPGTLRPSVGLIVVVILLAPSASAANSKAKSHPPQRPHTLAGLAERAYRGSAAPWSGRAHMKYRGTASYQVLLQNNQPVTHAVSTTKASAPMR